MSTQLLTPGKCSVIAVLGGVGLSAISAIMAGGAGVVASTAALGGVLGWLGGVAGNQVQSWLGSKLKNPPPNADEVFHNHHVRQLLSQALMSTVEKLVPLAKEKLGGVSQPLIDSGRTLAKRLEALIDSPSGTLAIVREFNVTTLLTDYATKQGRVELLSAQDWQQFIDEVPALQALPPGEHDLLVSTLQKNFGEALWNLVKHDAATDRQAFAAVELLYLAQILKSVQTIAGTPPPDLSPIITRISQLLNEIDQKHVGYFQSILSGITVLAGKFDTFFEAYRENRRKDEAFQAKTSAALDELLKRQPLNQYCRNLIARFSKHNSIGIPAVEDTKQKQGPDPIQQLFVQPTCTTERLRPEDLPTVLKDDKRKPTPLLSRLTTEKRIVLLADPGMGKSTLIHWLVVTLAEAVPSAEAVSLGRGIPLPIILRDIVPLMPPKLEGWTWKALISCFLKHRLDETQPGMAQPLSQDDDTLREIMQSPHAWFMIDGLDEVGDKQKRTALRDAIWQGFKAHPDARFLITSRVVGYGEAELDPLIDDDVLTEALMRDPSLYKSLFHRLKAGQAVTLDEAGTAEISLMEAIHVLRHPDAKLDADHFSKAIGASFVDRATRVYLSPWDDSQQSAFSEHWFTLRLGEHDGPIRARDFVRAVHDDPSTCAIGRVPNLLLLMALLYRYRADLPHGRAKVYAGISQAYLENIAQVCRIDHRNKTSVPYSFAQKERLLALLAMHLQLRRCAADEQGGKKSSAEPESEILASKEDLQRWLCVEFGQASDEANRHEMDKFIDHIADSSGLLLPRGVQDGQEQFAFAHLSFQEYYAACWLELEFSRLLNLHAATDDDLMATPTPPPDEELAMTESLFAKRAAFSVWREPLLFLAEKLSDRQSDTQTLRKWLFPIRKGQTLPMPAQQLLATFSIDPQVSFTPEQRQAIWDHLCRAHLANASTTRESVAPSLLVPSCYQQTILSLMANIFAETKQTSLDLTGCTGVSDLAALKGLTGLQRLILSGCTGVSDISALKDVYSLRWLILFGCTGVSDISALKDLRSLLWLSLTGCTGVSDLAVLKGLGSLKVLSLSGRTGVSDLAALNGLSSLEVLELRNCTGVSDLAVLKGLGNLQQLSLSGCTGVSDISALKDLGSLWTLDLNGCTGVKDWEKQIATLKKALPKCRIHS